MFVVVCVLVKGIIKLAIVPLSIYRLNPHEFQGKKYQEKHSVLTLLQKP